MVECSTTLNCSSDSELMSARKCCVNSVEGHAYAIPGSRECHTCIGMSSIYVPISSEVKVPSHDLQCLVGSKTLTVDWNWNLYTQFWLVTSKELK